MALCGSGSTTLTTETAAARASAPKLKSKKKHPPVKYHLSIKGLEQQLPLGADRSKGLMLLYITLSLVVITWSLSSGLERQRGLKRTKMMTKFLTSLLVFQLDLDNCQS